MSRSVRVLRPSTYRLPYVVLPCGHPVPRTTAGRTAHDCPGVKR